MNPLTQIKNTQKASKYEISAGFADSASWHARYKHSAYVFAGGLPFDLTEGDLLAIFAQYGELVDINLVKDRDTGALLPESHGLHCAAHEAAASDVPPRHLPGPPGCAAGAAGWSSHSGTPISQVAETEVR